MIASVFASLLAALGAQSAGAPAPLVAELCNETPARVAFTVSFPSRFGSERRRGWLVVEPGTCSGGSIGQTTGGTAYVHAMSGGYGWPAGSVRERRCAPAFSHDNPAASPPCRPGERAFDVAPVRLEDRGRRYRLEVTVACDQLEAAFQPLCRSGRTGPQGFAERVRTFEVCNRDRAAVDMAVAAERLDGQVAVSGWIPLQPGACETVWRGLTAQGVVYAHTRGAGQASGSGDYPRFCADDRDAFERIAAAPDGEETCGEGLVSLPFRPVSFGPNVSRMTLDIEEL